MRIKFKDLQMSKANIAFLDNVNSIIEEYQEDGYTLTLRQLYYQLVSRDIIPNQQREYRKLSRVLGEGRLAGIVDWDAIEDRLRQVSTVNTWASPKSILQAAANQFAFDRLQDQNCHVEVWVEKDALSQVVERAAHAYQVPVMVNRGYGSISAMFDTYERIISRELRGKESAVILYLGDHDPSGLDMVRDIRDRLTIFLDRDDMAYQLEVRHIALTREQIEQYNPPPNPAKLTDSRSGDYVSEHGGQSWEVDALEPRVLNELITSQIESLIDVDSYREWEEKEESVKDKMNDLIDKF